MDKDKQTKTIPIDAKPPRKLATFFIRTDILELIGQWSDKSGYSRGQVIEQAITELQKQQEVEAA